MSYDARFCRSFSLRGAILVTFAILSACASDESRFLDDLEGRWELTRAAEVVSPAGSVYRRETVTFGRDRNVVEAEFYADPELTQLLFVYVSEGPFTIVGPSELAEDAFEVRLTNDTQALELAADVPELLAAVGWDDCSLEVGVAVDVTNGCASPPLPPADCVERDVWQIVDRDDGTYLRWGDTSIDRCVEAPTRFDPIELVRIE
jgi:hypothetical protein